MTIPLKKMPTTPTGIFSKIDLEIAQPKSTSIIGENQRSIEQNADERAAETKQTSPRLQS